MFQQGDQIGSYSLVGKLGRGAFGEVWLAEEKTAISSHKAALKLPNEEDVDLEAIRQEADVWENVKGHPNILPIIKADIFEGQIYIASEYAPDGSLSEWLKKHGGKAPTVEIAVQMTKGILAGLEHLHSKGVIHRDLKPANILLQSDTPRIADFGIARLAKAGATANSTTSAGTPSYMAPECFYSVRSEQTDIWAVGVLFHKLLSGKLPFSHPDQVSVMNAILNSDPEIDDEIPEFLREIITKALQKDTAERYKSAAEMRADLNSFVPVAINEETVAPKPAAKPLVVPVTAPKVEREEETIVHPKPAAVYLEPEVVYHTRRSGGGKTWAIATACLLGLAAVTVWATLQFAGNETESQPTFTNSTTNQSNGLFNLNNGRNGNQGNFATSSNGRIGSPGTTISNVGVPSSTDSNVSANAGENPAGTPYDIKPDEPVENPDLRLRGRQTRTPSTDEKENPSPTPEPKTEGTPIEIAPMPSATAPPMRQRTTPKPTEKPAETPPPLKQDGETGNN